MLKGPHFVLAHLKKKDQKNVSWHESKTGINNQGIDEWEANDGHLVAINPGTIWTLVPETRYKKANQEDVIATDRISL